MADLPATTYFTVTVPPEPPPIRAMHSDPVWVELREWLDWLAVQPVGSYFRLEFRDELHASRAGNQISSYGRSRHDQPNGGFRFATTRPNKDTNPNEVFVTKFAVDL